MIKKLSVIFAVIMIFSCFLFGCSGENEGMAGSVGMDGYELVECDPREDELEVYVDNIKLGTFTLTKSGDGWTFSKANKYLSYSLKSKAITYDFNPFTWYYDGTGLYCYIQGNNNKLYIQKNGKSIGIAKVSVKFKNWVYQGTEATKDTVAEVTTPNGTEYYDSFFEAWDMVNENTNVPVTIKLYQGLNGNTASEMIVPASRSSDAPLVIDLGGHIIDRQLYGTTANGSVFCLNNPGDITVKNGTVTGGYTDAKGGGFYIDSTGLKVTLEDLVVKNNEAAQAGGGIYVSENTESLTLNNIKVTSNYCTNGNSAGVAWNCSGTKYANLTVKGTVNISENFGDVGVTNLSMIGDFVLRELNVEGLGEGSNIGVNYPDFKTGTFTKELSNTETIKNYFFSDFENFAVKEEGNRLTIGIETDNVKAGVCYNGKWEYFDTFSEAWGRANDEAYSDADCTVMLFDDWIAENGSLGDGYFFEGGALQPRERKNDDSWLIVNLNGYTIDRGLYKVDSNGNVIVDDTRENGCVFNIQGGSEEVNVKIMNGTITGGNNSMSGGAIRTERTFDNGPSNIELINLTIKNNKCTSQGGGIYHNGGDMRIIDTTIINNVSVKNGGGVYVNTDMTLEGKVVIKNNVGNYWYDNFCLSKNTVIDGTKLSADMESNSIGITIYTDGYNSSYKMVNLSSENEKYLQIFHSDDGSKLYFDSNVLWTDKSNLIA